MPPALTITQQITGVFTDIGADIIPIMVPVATAGAGVLVVFLGFKYGKKIFNRIAG